MYRENSIPDDLVRGQDVVFNSWVVILWAGVGALFVVAGLIQYFRG